MSDHPRHIMYFVVLFSILIAVSAGKPMKSDLPTYPKAGPTAPKPCCAPDQYTYTLEGNTALVLFNQLFTVFSRTHEAYDSINKLIARKTVADFSNGTEEAGKAILDFNRGEGYLIYKDKGAVDCYKFEIRGQFPENCLPDDAKFIGSATVGDRALLSDQWYVSYNSTSTDETYHYVFSIKGDGCVDLGSYGRSVDSKTGETKTSSSTAWYDFKLGIDDRASWFKPPSECENAKVTEVPNQLRHYVMYGGKVTLFD